MTEEEVNYASVIFKTKKQSRAEVKSEEETVYDEVKEGKKATEQIPDTNAGFLPYKKASRCHHCRRQACCLAALCVILLLGIIAASVYYLTNKLSSNTEDLRRTQTNLEIQIHNLTQASTVLEKQVTNLTEEKQNLTQKNEALQREKQELQTEKKNLTEQIQHMKTSWKEPSVNQSQWSIDAYCPKEKNNRSCKPCQEGWLNFQSSCYVINDAKPPDQKTWEEARGNCRGKFSDLVVVVNDDEKKYVSDNSWGSSGNKGYWIGLRVEDGKWKWVDGSDLTNTSWIQQPPSDGLCAISVENQGFKSVSCTQKNRWICKKKSLSV